MSAQDNLYQDLISDYFRAENIVSVKGLCMFHLMANPAKAADYIRTSSYVRWVDDCIDNVLDCSGIDAFLDRQISLMSSALRSPERTAPARQPGQQPGAQVLADHIQERNISDILKTYRQPFFAALLQLFDGFKVDAELKRTRLPLDADTLYRRNVDLCVTCFDYWSQILFARQFDYGTGFQDLMQTWIRYDALRDLKDDFRSGIVLFSREELAKAGIDRADALASSGNWASFFDQEKKVTLRQLISRSAAAYDNNIPFTYQAALQTYFLTRPRKLLFLRNPFLEAEQSRVLPSALH